MKFKHSLLIIIALLICATSNTYAGFLVKKQKQTTTQNSVTNINEFSAPPVLNLATEGHTSKFAIAKDYVRTMIDGKKDSKGGHTNTGWEGIAAIICGGLSLILLFTPMALVSLPLGIAAVVFGALGSSRRKPHHGLAIAGLIMGALTLFIFILAILIVAAFVGALL